MSVHTRAQLEALIHRVTSGVSVVELVHTPHEFWPYSTGKRPTAVQLQSFRHDTRVTADQRTAALKISVLDSSFNPPTLAHLALASLPGPHVAEARGDEVTSDFDARLLLLSVRNADKSLKSTDATYVQRLEMMIHLSKEVSSAPQVLSKPPFSDPQGLRDDPQRSNVAVAIIDEPTFVGKARTLHTFLRERIASVQALSAFSGSDPPSEGSGPDDPELTFIVGIDTLERILATRYYPSPAEMRTYLEQFMASARLLCSRRLVPGQLSDTQAEREEKVLSLARDYLDVTKLSMVDIGEELETYSSSEVRQRIGQGDSAMWMRMVTPAIADYVSTQGLYVAKGTET